MEEVLTVKLFNRTKRSVALTAAGEVFQIEAQRALDQIEQAQDIAKRAGRGELGRLELGYVASAAYSGVLQEHLSYFRKSHPGIHVHSKEYVMDQLPELLDQGRLDLAFVRPPMRFPEGIDSVVLLKDRFVLAVREDCWLAQLTIVSPSQLSNELFVVPEQEIGTAEIAKRGRFNPRIVARPGSLTAVLTEVSFGTACAIVPQSVVNHVRLPGVCFREFSGKIVSSEIAALYRRHEKAPAARAFIKQINMAKKSQA